MNIIGGATVFKFAIINENGKRLREEDEYSEANKRHKIFSDSLGLNENSSPQDYIDALALMCKEMVEDVYCLYDCNGLPNLPDECWKLAHWIIDNIDFGQLSDHYEVLFSKLIDISCYNKHFDLAEKLILKLPYLYQETWGYGETMLTYMLDEMPKKLLSLLVFLRKTSHDNPGEILQVYHFLEGDLGGDAISEIGERVARAQEEIVPIQSETSKIFNNIFLTLYCESSALSGLPSELKEEIYKEAITNSKYLKDIPLPLIRDQIHRLENLYAKVKSDMDIDLQAGRLVHTLRVSIATARSEGVVVDLLSSEEAKLLKDFTLLKLKQNRPISQEGLFNLIRG